MDAGEHDEVLGSLTVTNDPTLAGRSDDRHVRTVHLDDQLLGALWADGSYWMWATADELAADDTPWPGTRREDTVDVALYRLLKTATGASFHAVRATIAAAQQRLAA